MEPIVFGFVVLWPSMRVQTRVFGDGFVQPILEAQAGALGGLNGGGAGPLANARDIPRHRSIHVLDRRLAVRESPDARRRRHAAILSGVMVKKRLSTTSPRRVAGRS
jgi:hypothetical protein